MLQLLFLPIVLLLPTKLLLYTMLLLLFTRLRLPIMRPGLCTMHPDQCTKHLSLCTMLPSLCTMYPSLFIMNRPTLSLLPTPTNMVLLMTTVDPGSMPRSLAMVMPQQDPTQLTFPMEGLKLSTTMLLMTTVVMLLMYSTLESLTMLLPPPTSLPTSLSQLTTPKSLITSGAIKLFYLY